MKLDNVQPFAFIAVNDLVAITRGRSLPKSELNPKSGVGWVPADLALNAFGALADPNPFGALGDLRLIPDMSTKAVFSGKDFGRDIEVYLADQHTMNGEPWECCPRTSLKHAISRLKNDHGLEVVASFEHEFVAKRCDGSALPGSAFGLDAMLAAEPFGSEVWDACIAAGIELENWLPEYGSGQFEITMTPQDALKASDHAVILKEIVRHVAGENQLRASFVPLPHPDSVGNGVHVHLSLTRNGKPVTYDPNGKAGLSKVAETAFAGVLDHAAGILAWTAPSQVSALRLTPHRWSAGGICIGRQNREALLRICPIPSGSDPNKIFNIEFRAADATANPHLVMSCLVNAMCDGLDRGLQIENIVDDHIDNAQVPPLPATLKEAIAAFKSDAVMNSWFAKDLIDTHLSIRDSEEKTLAGLDNPAKCARYAEVY
jgi:glutamine synthetase